MQLALYGSIAWRHPLGVGQVVRWAQEFGWDMIDLRGMSLDAPGQVEKQIVPWGYDMVGPRHIAPQARDQIRGMIQDAGLELLCIYCPVPVHVPGPWGQELRQLAAQYVDLAAQLGAQWLRPINNTPQLPDGTLLGQQEAFDRTVQGLQELAQRAASWGVGLLLENNENTVTPGAEELLQMKAALQELCRVGVCWDGANAYMQGLDPADELAMLEDQVDVIHVKNVQRCAPGQEGYMPRGNFSYRWTPLEEGDLDWQALLTQARKQGFSGPVVYEYVNPFKGMPLQFWERMLPPEQAAQRASQFLRRVLGG